jgi:murein DD-endopeptidase MepM/ murein hydrolase activator NlpD|tara:strand:+ start:610 stop:1194 length:585 start_codon:yes stop_codon:yes gene_type:complete
MNGKLLAILIILLLAHTQAKSGESFSRLQQFGNYKADVFKLSITGSIPLYSPIPLNSLKKDLDACSSIGLRVHPIYKIRKQHKGIDLTASTGTPVISTIHGQVQFVGNKNNGYGNQIVLVSGIYLIRYAHLSEIATELFLVDSLGNRPKVVFGQEIGKVGSTGSSTGPHLHYEIYKNGFLQNPLRYIKADKSIF